MHHIDVFNGDADGICSLIQLRRGHPVESKLITGVKRDIKLLARIPCAEENVQITVLDVSYEKNAKDVNRLLDQGASIEYYDHHKTGEITKHKQLSLNVNLSADACTALLVDKTLHSKYQAWALTGAFGDNLNKVASQQAQASGFTENQIQQMHQLGYLINYNAYGDSIEDLHYSPAGLFKLMLPYDDPFGFIADNQAVFNTLRAGYDEDMQQAENVKAFSQTTNTRVYILPNETWAKRVSGVLSNQLTNLLPDHAIAVLREKGDATFIVSIRAPLNNRQGADIVASQFPTGGGRKAAAGINALPRKMLEQFITIFDAFYA